MKRSLLSLHAVLRAVARAAVRALSTTARALAPAFVPATLATAALLGCNGKVTRAECTEMLDRYIDMTVAGEPGLADLPEAEARAARDMKKALRKGDTRYMRVQEQCEAEITRREYRCAMKAPSPETWQACID